MMRRAFALALALSLAASSASRQKKNKEQETQTLEMPPEPPAAVVADSARLVFRVTPLSARGLLSQQVRDALKWLARQDRATLVKLRAFVAGSGDMRRVPQIVSEVYSEKRQALPAVTVVQVGQLPLAGAQVIFESVAQDKREMNPAGLAFFSGQATTVNRPLEPVLPLAEKSLARLRAAAAAAGLEPGDLLRVTCYVSSLDNVEAVQSRAAAEFPNAALNFVQRLREPLESVAECEAVARLRTRPAAALSFLNPPEMGHEPGQSDIALVGPGRIALTGAQLAFGGSPADARLAFERLGKALEQVRTGYAHTAVSQVYTLSRSASELVRKTRLDFYNRAQPPAGTVAPIEGLPSLDASFGVDVVAVAP
jgi:enamine deaminase RidA (YjgF/YER057c/UK114 family)